ncbi:MAG: hypothetical protein AAGC79_11215 [Pseudomonadota bacterium]
MSLLYYYPIALSGLAVLSTILVLIGRATKDCPQLSGAARLVSMIVTTGFATIGVGVIALIGAFSPRFGDQLIEVVSVAVGLAAIALGFGFWTAAVNLRDLLKDAQLSRPLPSGGA